MRYLVLKNQSLHNWYKYYNNEFFNKLISLKLLLPKEYLYLKNVHVLILLLIFFAIQSTLTWIKQISYICYNWFFLCVTNRNYKTIIGGLWITQTASSTQITWCISATWEWGWQRSEWARFPARSPMRTSSSFLDLWHLLGRLNQLILTVWVCVCVWGSPRVLTQSWVGLTMLLMILCHPQNQGFT